MFWSSIVQSFLKFYNKDDFDFGASNIAILDFHPQLLTVLAINGIFFNNKESKLRFLWPFVCVGMAIVGTVFELMMLAHHVLINDFSMATECFTYAIVVIVVLVLYPCTLLRRQVLYGLVDDMNADFAYLCSLDPRFRDAFLAGQLRIWRMGILWSLFMVVIVTFYCSLIVFELLYMSLLAAQDEHTIRPLIFPIWLPNDDPYRSPNYEIFLFVQYIVIMDVAVTFGGYVYVLFHFLLHGLNQMDMIIIAITHMFDGLDESVVSLERDDARRKEVQRMLNKRFEQIVTWHIAVFGTVERVMEVYGPVLVYQVSLSSVAICLMAYQVADQLDNGKFDILFALLWLGCCVQLWIPCYIGTLLQAKGFMINEACWWCGWHETRLARLACVDLSLVMMRSQIPITMQFTGLPSLSLLTFSSIMRSAYSYFNMLRQMNKEM